MKQDTCKTKDVIIIGGGASGLLCGYLIKKSSRNINVAILEASDRVGKKLSVTGNGRCNLTNMNITPDMYYGSFDYCGKHLLEVYPPEFIIETFREMGLLTKVEDNGLVYPLCKQASAVVDVLRKNCSNFGVETATGTKVRNITYSSGIYCVDTENDRYKAKKIVIATGGKSSPSTGADISVLKILEKMGHTLTPLSPSLCPVTVKSPYLKSLKGIRVSARVDILANGKVIKSQRGELQFTENALSGICIFNLSRIANIYKESIIKVSLLPDYPEDEIFTMIKEKISTLNKNAICEDIFIGWFHKMIGIALLKEVKISPQDKISSLDDENLREISKLINNWSFQVVPHNDFSKAQVTAGGIKGNEIDMNTMESKLFKNMYILGEATDCDGDCGGVNLQYAFSSAIAASRGIVK